MIDQTVNDLLLALDWAVQTSAYSARLTPDLADRIASRAVTVPVEPGAP